MRLKHTLLNVIRYVVSAGQDEGARWGLLRNAKQALFWPLPPPGRRWVDAEINLAEAMNTAAGKTGWGESLGVDRYIIGLGAWCSDESGSGSIVDFDAVDLTPDGSKAMQIDGKPFDATKQGLELIQVDQKP